MAVYTVATKAFGLTLGNKIMGYVSIAATHTGYKTVIALMQLPFIDLLITLAKRIYPDSPEEEKFAMLDNRLLSTPGIAVRTSTDLTIEMVEITRQNVMESLLVLGEYKDETIQAIEKGEERVDHYEDRLGTYMAELSGHDMMDEDRKELSRLLHCIGDYERISDHAVNISETATEMHEKNLVFSPEAVKELNVMGRAVMEIVDLTSEAFIKNSPAMAKKVEPLEEMIDNLTVQLKARHVARLQRGECTTLLGFVFSDLITSFERIADHCSNIAICIIQSSKNVYDAHVYLDKLQESDDKQFRELYAEYQVKYALPKE